MNRKTRDSIMLELRRSQKKLRAAKGRKDNSTVRFLQARIKILQGEMATRDQDT